MCRQRLPWSVTRNSFSASFRTQPSGTTGVSARSAWLQEIADVRTNYDRAIANTSARTTTTCRYIPRGLRGSFVK